MTPLIALFLLAQDPPPLHRDVPLGHLTIPDEIAPAIVPYLNCLMASRGVQMRSHDNAIQAPLAAVGADCSSARREAARRANEMLINQHRGTLPQRRAFIERALTSAEQFANQSAMPPPVPPEEGK